MSNSLRHRILIATLSHAKVGERFDINEIASLARTTPDAVRTTISNLTSTNLSSDSNSLSSIDRIQLAIEAARDGLQDVAKMLTWQEFETFTEQCLRLAGFETVKGVIAHGQGRKWQIDLVGKKGPMLLVFDCKHWHSSYSPGRMQNSAQHQKDALLAMLKDPKCRKKFAEQKLWALPIILTLLEPQARSLDEAVIVPLEKLSDFLNGITPYATEFPFIESNINSLETPMSVP